MTLPFEIAWYWWLLLGALLIRAGEGEAAPTDLERVEAKLQETIAYARELERKIYDRPDIHRPFNSRRKVDAPQ